MYKKQLTVQRVLCLAAIVVSVVLFLYSLGIMTDLYDALYDTMRNPTTCTRRTFPDRSCTTICRSLTSIF